MTSSPQQVTELLHDWRNGDRQALDELMPLVYEELRRIAHRYMRRERPGQSMQTTALVNEAYLRLVDRARARQYEKRGGGARQVSLDEAAAVSPAQDLNLLALDEVLEKLAAIDERKSRLVELRYFGGLSAEEAAAVLGVSEITVKREWLKAKAWLYRELTKGGGDDA